MRRLAMLLVALALLVGVAGTAAANCGADHTNTVGTPPTQPLPQS